VKGIRDGQILSSKSLVMTFLGCRSDVKRNQSREATEVKLPPILPIDRPHSGHRKPLYRCSRTYTPAFLNNHRRLMINSHRRGEKNFLGFDLCPQHFQELCQPLGMGWPSGCSDEVAIHMSLIHWYIDEFAACTSHIGSHGRIS
jgi:hypothetical protein